MRRSSKTINIGKIKIGGNNPIAVQSMVNVPSYDVEKSILQAMELKKAGCEILRIAIPNMEAVKLIEKIKSSIDIPLVADIHFNYKLALEAISAGVDKIRINPGNIGDENKIKEIANACSLNKIPIRVGVNSGSIEKHILEKHGAPSAEAMAESALYNVFLLEKYNFNDIIISIKASDIYRTVEANRIVASRCDYPLHLGVTESGTEKSGIIKSSIGIGSLLLDGIGDTIRVSLTASPVKEIEAGFEILKSLELRKSGIRFTSCPTCGRTRINLIKIAEEVENRLKDYPTDLKVAIMGCVVNGPGEAKDADIGITGADGMGIIFKKGEIIKKVPEENLVEELVKEIKSMDSKK